MTTLLTGASGFLGGKYLEIIKEQKEWNTKNVKDMDNLMEIINQRDEKIISLIEYNRACEEKLT